MKAEQASHVFQGHFQILARGHLLAVWHLFLVGIMVFAVVFQVCLGCWIVVRLARTSKT